MKLSLRKIAEYFGVSESTIYRWIDRKGLPGTKLYGEFRTNPVQLLEWSILQQIPISPQVFNHCSSDQHFNQRKVGHQIRELDRLDQAIENMHEYQRITTESPRKNYETLLSTIFKNGASKDDQTDPGSSIVNPRDNRIRDELATVLTLRHGDRNKTAWIEYKNIRLPHPRYPLLVPEKQLLTIIIRDKSKVNEPYCATKNHAVENIPTSLLLITPNMTSYLAWLSRWYYAISDSRFYEVLIHGGDCRELQAEARRIESLWCSSNSSFLGH